MFKFRKCENRWQLLKCGGTWARAPGRRAAGRGSNPKQARGADGAGPAVVTEKAILDKFLLGSRVASFPAIVDFEEKFPTKMRSTPTLAAVYAAFAAKRAGLREKVSRGWECRDFA